MQCLKIPNKVLLHVKIMFIVKCCWLWFMAVQTGTQHISFFVTSAYYHWSWSSTQGHWCLLGDRKSDGGPYYYHFKILKEKYTYSLSFRRTWLMYLVLCLSQNCKRLLPLNDCAALAYCCGAQFIDMWKPVPINNLAMRNGIQIYNITATS